MCQSPARHGPCDETIALRLDALRTLQSTHGRHCGEIMGLHQHHLLHGDKDIASFLGTPRVVSVRVIKSAERLVVDNPAALALLN